MNLEQIRNLPDGPIPDTFYVQLKEMKYPPDGNKPAKVKLTDGSVGQVSAVIWRPAVPLQQFSWYEVIPGQDNQRREKVHIQSKEYNGKPYRELSIDGTAFLGPVPPPPEPSGAPQSPAPAQGTSPPQKRAQGGSGDVQRQDSSVPTDRDFVRWLKEAGEAVAGVVSGWGDPTTPHGEAAVITTVGSILAGMRIGAEHGKLRLTYGEEPSRAQGRPLPPPMDGEEQAPYPPSGFPDDEDVPDRKSVV